MPQNTMHLVIAVKMDIKKFFIVLVHFHFALSDISISLGQSGVNSAAAIPVLKNSSCLTPLSFQQFDNSTFGCVRWDGSKKLSDAIPECQKIYAYPACIITDTLLNAVGDLSMVEKYRTFTFGAYLDATGQWTCCNGQKIASPDVLKWYPGEPSGGILEKCLRFVLQGTDYLINDTLCNSQSPYMCEFSVKCDRMKPNEFYHIGNYSYCFNNVLTTYAEAEAICYSIGGQMACPRDSNTTAFFQRVATAREMPNVYIGLSDQTSEGSFRCWDGTVPNSSDWLSGEPNGGVYENCASLAKSASYKLADYTCERPHYSICEIPYSGR